MRILYLAALCSCLSAQEPTTAQPAPRAWTNVSTLSFVATDGNAQGQTLGFANEYGYKWSLSTLSLKASAVRANSTVVTRSATGTSLDDAVVNEQRITTTTAEMFGVGGRLDHRLKEKDRYYGFVAANWERNRPAGLDSKTSAILGSGRIWADSDATKFRTDLGVGWSHERPVVIPDGFKTSYGTANLNSQLKQKIGTTTLYTMDLAVSDNLSDTQDWQGALKQGLTVSISKRLALKVGYDLLYRNRPNKIAVEVFSTGLPPVSLGTVAIPAKKTDSVATTSLVVTF